MLDRPRRACLGASYPGPLGSERFNELVRLGVDGVTTANLAILEAVSG